MLPDPALELYRAAKKGDNAKIDALLQIQQYLKQHKEAFPLCHLP